MAYNIGPFNYYLVGWRPYECKDNSSFPCHFSEIYTISPNPSEKEINNQHKINTPLKLCECIEKAIRGSLNQQIFSTFLLVTPETFFLLFFFFPSLSVTSYDVWMKAFSHAVMTVYWDFKGLFMTIPFSV